MSKASYASSLIIIFLVSLSFFAFTGVTSEKDHLELGDGSPHKQNVEPEPNDDDENAKLTNWGPPVFASLVITLTSLVGVILLSLGRSKAEEIIRYMSSFAAGCLLSVCVFHLYPEGSEYLEGEAEWIVGYCVLGGVTFALIVEQGLHILLAAHGVDNCPHSKDHKHQHHHQHHHQHDHEHEHHHHKHQHQHQHHHIGSSDSSARFSQDILLFNMEENKYDVTNGSTFKEKYLLSLRYVDPVAYVTAMADIIHALTDGIVLAVAFRSCSVSAGWAVAFGIILHEVPHRVGDFFVFLKAGMNVTQALVLNFVSSCASLAGVIVLLSFGSVHEKTLGYLLAFGAGNLLFIALTALLPPMLAVREIKSALLHFFCFAIGCILIGLSLLQDVHCDVSTGQVHEH
jgi:zinc transporter ZupT